MVELSMLPETTPTAPELTLGQRCVEAIRASLVSSGKHWRDLKGNDVAAIIDAMPVVKPAKRPVVHRGSPLMASDEDWLKTLEAEPALAGIDIRKELGKLQFWCKSRGFLPTRQRFQNWLLKADRTVQANGQGQTSFDRKPMPFGLPEPERWREWLDVNRPESVYATGNANGNMLWHQLDFTVKKFLLEQINQGTK